MLARFRFRWMTLAALFAVTACGSDERPSSIRVRAGLGASFAESSAATSSRRARVSSAVPDSVVAVQHRRGAAGVSDVSAAKTAPLTTDGSFELELETDRDWVLFLVNGDAALTERIVAYVTIPASEETLVDLPASKATSDVDMGTLDRDSSGDARSDSNTESVAQSFALNVSDLDFLALVDSGIKQIANNYLNYAPETGTYYESNVTFGWAANLAAIGDASAGDYGFTGLSYSIFTNAPQLVGQVGDYCDGTRTFAVTPAREVRLFGGGWLRDDLLLEDAQIYDDGSCEANGVALRGNGSVAQIGIRPPMATTGTGYWAIALDGELAAAFDFGHSSPTLGHDPLVPVPVPTPQYDRDGYLTGVALQWVVFSQETRTYAPANLSALALLVASSFVDVVDGFGQTEIVSSTDDQPLLSSASFARTWAIDPDLVRAGVLPVQQIRVEYAMGGNSYSFIWTVNPFCGDSSVERWLEETCDRTDLDGQTCASLGCGPGTLECDETCRWDVAGCEQGLTWQWQEVGTLNAARQLHGAVKLADGRVLIAGGLDAGGQTLDSAEIYDPVAKTFSLTGSMSEPRAHHTMTVLSDGSVLVVGGESTSGGRSNTVELYDPTAGTFSYAGTMSTARSHHTATYVPAYDRVALIGGNAEGQADGEWWDVLSGEPLGNTLTMSEGRSQHTADLLSNGAIAIVGGQLTSISKTIDLLEDGGVDIASPITDTMSHYRSGHRSVRLADGSLLFVGGRGGSYADLATAAPNLELERFFVDERYEVFSTDARPPALEHHTATALSSGHVVVFGDDGESCAGAPCGNQYIYYPSTGRITEHDATLAGSAMNAPRHSHTAVLLDDGTVLVAGGLGATVLDHAELLVVQ